MEFLGNVPNTTDPDQTKRATLAPPSDEKGSAQEMTRKPVLLVTKSEKNRWTMTKGGETTVVTNVRHKSDPRTRNTRSTEGPVGRRGGGEEEEVERSRRQSATPRNGPANPDQSRRSTENGCIFCLCEYIM